MIEIVPNLFIGNETDAKISTDMVDIVINCTRDISFYSNKPLQIRVAVDDDGSDYSMACMKRELKDVVTFISKHIDNNVILVHCRNGQQRSATIIAAYLISTYSEKSFQNIIQQIKQKKPDAFFYKINFYHPLQEYYNELKTDLASTKLPRISNSIT